MASESFPMLPKHCLKVYLLLAGDSELLGQHLLWINTDANWDGPESEDDDNYVRDDSVDGVVSPYSFICYESVRLIIKSFQVSRTTKLLNLKQLDLKSEVKTVPLKRRIYIQVCRWV